MVIAAAGVVDLHFWGSALTDEPSVYSGVIVDIEQFFPDFVFRLEICSACFDRAICGGFLADCSNVADWIGSR